MGEVKTEHQNVLNEFLSRAMGRPMTVTRVLNFKAVDTANSMYAAIECNGYEAYELAISDHRNYSHHHRLGEIVGQGARRISRHRLRDDMFGYGIRVPSIHTMNSDNFYSITRCRQYRIDPRKLVGRYASHLAFMSDSYVVKDALVLDNKQVLMITYSDPDGNDITHGYYVNYDPIGKGCTARDIVAIQYLKNHYDIRTARRIYYRDWYDLETIDEHDAEPDDMRHLPRTISKRLDANGHHITFLADDASEQKDTFEMNGTRYVFFLKATNPQIVLSKRMNR